MNWNAISKISRYLNDPLILIHPFMIRHPLIGVLQTLWSLGKFRKTWRRRRRITLAHIIIFLFRCPVRPIVKRAPSILYSELWTVVSIMKYRANQRRVDEEVEQEALIECSSAREFHEKIKKYDFESTKGKHFLSLLLSYIGVQHARVIFAFMDRDTLRIC